MRKVSNSKYCFHAVQAVTILKAHPGSFLALFVKVKMRILARVQNLVLSSTTLECNTWSRVKPHYTATLYMLNYMKVLPFAK